MNTKTDPNGYHFVAVWGRFGVQLGSLEKKIDDGGPDRATLLHMVASDDKKAINFLKRQSKRDKKRKRDHRVRDEKSSEL